MKMTSRSLGLYEYRTYKRCRQGTRTHLSRQLTPELVLRSFLEVADFRP